MMHRVWAALASRALAIWKTISHSPVGAARPMSKHRRPSSRDAQFLT